jgi:hypothetical protein
VNTIEILGFAPPHVASEAIAALREIERRRSAGEITAVQAAGKLDLLIDALIEARKTAAEIEANTPDRWAPRSRVAIA